jgi:hypothetical protein
MKKINLMRYALLLLIFGIFSCSNDDDLGKEEYISSTINQEKWNGGDPEISLDQENDSLTLLGFGNDQAIYFKIKFKGEGVYNLSGSQASYYTTVGGDVMTSLYILDPGSSSEITITDYDPEQKIVTGTFAVNLLQEWSNPENDINSLTLTDGEFRGSIISN